MGLTTVGPTAIGQVIARATVISFEKQDVVSKKEIKKLFKESVKKFTAGRDTMYQFEVADTTIGTAKIKYKEYPVWPGKEKELAIGIAFKENFFIVSCKGYVISIERELEDKELDSMIKAVNGADSSYYYRVQSNKINKESKQVLSAYITPKIK